MQESLVEYGSRRIIITVTAVLCALLEIVDTTIVNVALNDMKGTLGATVGEISWVITAYSLANVIVVPLTSWLGQQFGRRNYFAVSIVLFTISSFLCGNATGLWELVAFRFMQGLGGGALLVTSQTIITESWPIEKRPMAQAIYGIGVITGPTLGPPLGGYIVDNFSWPYIFYINIPIGIIATVLTLLFVRSPKYGGHKRSNVDWLGIGLLAASVGALQYVLEKGQEEDWFASGLILSLSIVAVLGIFFFIWRELTAENPVVELRVLKNVNLSIGTILSFVLGFGLFGSTFILPLYTQSMLGWTAQKSGMLQLPSTIFVAFMMPVVGQLIQRGVPQKYMIAVGMSIFFLYCLFSYKIMSPWTGSEHFFWILILRGFGMGLLSIPISTMALSTLRGKEIGQGAAFTGMMRQLGGSFGIALISSFVTHQVSVHANDLSANITADNPLVQQRLQTGGNPQMVYASLYGTIMKQATLLSYMDVFLYVGVMFLICVPLVLLFVKRGQTKVSLAEAAH